jgi:spore coat polysaccharide biosynthesis protein SpsF
MPGTVVIVQARLGSTRLPGKVLMDLAGMTVLEHVLRRCAAIPGIDHVCCATTLAPYDAAVAEAASSMGFAVHRGSERDVLDRYLGAARALDASVVMRVTSDCPFIDPDICGALLKLRAERGADFACNNDPPSWTHGMDCEAFPMAILERAAREGHEPDDREHVTEWMRRAPGLTHANLAGPGGSLLDYRLTLDYPEDLAMMRALCAALPMVPLDARLDDLIAVLDTRPEIATLNADRHRPY